MYGRVVLLALFGNLPTLWGVAGTFVAAHRADADAELALQP